MCQRLASTPHSYAKRPGDCTPFTSSRTPCRNCS
jgi:hypothetical protein